MGDAINQLFFAGNERIDIVRHLVERHAEPLKTGTAVKMQPFTQVSFTKPLRRRFQPQHLLPVRTHPDKHREGQRNGDERHQRDVQQAHLMQKIEIGNRADGKDIMAARNTLNKGVLVVECHNITLAQTLLGRDIQMVFIQRLHTQIKREV
ncbi:hypothetical protein D3C73_1177770 [compost metagenome]